MINSLENFFDRRNRLGVAASRSAVGVEAGISSNPAGPVLRPRQNIYTISEINVPDFPPQYDQLDNIAAPSVTPSESPPAYDTLYPKNNNNNVNSSR